jgi:Putative DNA-binding domain
MLLDGKRIEDVSATDLQALVDLKVREGKALDFKRDLPRTDRPDFGADVSALANTAGGWIVLGMDEQDGVAKELVGITGESADKAILRLQQMLDSRLDPRVVGVHFREIPLDDGRYAIVVRVPRSWSAPHLVTVNDSYRGYLRGSRGNTLLDVEGLRNAFAAADTVPERLRSFRAERVRKVAAGEVTMGFGDAAILVVHVMPLSVLSSGSPIDLHRQIPQNLILGEHPVFLGSQRFNLEGQLRFDRDKAYLQIFRSGALEFAFRYGDKKERKLYSGIDWFLIKETTWLLNLVRAHDLEPPFAVMVSFLGFHGWHFAFDPSRGFMLDDDVHEIDRDEILLPELLVDHADTDMKTAMKPLLDMLWNCAGFDGSLNYDKQGAWVGKEY